MYIAGSSGVRAPEISSFQVCDPFLDLPLTEEDQENITSLITTLKVKSYIELGFMKSRLNRLGAKINSSVHPLRFIAYIFLDPKLKSHLSSIAKDSLKWGNFRKGFEQTMKKMEQDGNVALYVEGFAKAVGLSKERVASLLAAGAYSDLLKILFS